MNNVDIKSVILGLDLDTAYHLLGRERYVDAQNITLDAVAGNYDKVITNIVGTLKVSYTYPDGRGKYIGLYGSQLRNTVIGFRWNENGYHGIYELDISNKSITKIFESKTDSAGIDILNFTENNKVHSVNVLVRDEGDLLFFLDSQGRPTTLNISSFKSGVYTPVTRDIIDVGKLPPLSPPICSYDNDLLTKTNNLTNKLLRFKYRWVYADNEKSTFSPISIVPLPANILNDTFTNVLTNNNVLKLSFNSGGKDVKAIEIAISFVNKTNNWSDFSLVQSYNKVDNSIPDNTNFPYSFYNDGTYPTIDVNESILLFDYVPFVALSQELANNVLLYAGVTEGYDRVLSPNVVVAIPTTPVKITDIGTLSVVLNFDNTSGGNWDIRWKFFGTPATGTLIQLKVQRASDGAPLFVANYTTIGGDTADSVVNGIISKTNVPFVSPFIGSFHQSTAELKNILSNTYYEPNVSNGLYTEIVITPPINSATSNSIPTWKWSTSQNVAIAYFDKKGVTNGVLYNAKIIFPAVAESGGNVLIPYVNIKIYHIPPEWAWSYQILFTKEPTGYIYWETIGVNTSETGAIYFDVSNFKTNQDRYPTTSAVLNYDFVNGDRMRLIKDMSSGFVFADTFDAAIDGLVVDPKIGSAKVTGVFIKIKNVAPFTAITGELAANKNFVIELYRPAQTVPVEQQIFFECGQQYAILNPETANRVHAGMVTDQNIFNNIPAEINIYGGEAYFRTRTIPLSDTGSVGTERFYVMDRNFVDNYPSAVNTIDGRPNEIDINAKRATYPATIRFGQEFEPYTNINGLNRFYPLDFEDCEAAFGGIRRMKVRARFMRIFQELKIGTIQLFNQIMKGKDGNNVQVETSKLLNPVQYNVENAGIGDNPESLASYNYADYCASNIRGAFIRVSNDGTILISEKYLINSWATDKLPLRFGNSKVYGAFDPKSNNYIAALEEAPEPNAMMIAHELLFPYSGVYGRGNNINTACGSSSQLTLYTGAPFGLGVILYIDAGLTTPLIDYNYVTTADGHVYAVDSLTGQVLEETSGVCFTGLPNNYIIGNDSSIVCAGTVQVLYTDGVFDIGKILYYDSALVIPVTGFAFVVNVATQIIYNVNISTGVILSVTGSSCTTYPIGNMEIDNRTSIDIVISDVQVNGNSVTITSGSGSFPINQGQEVSATTNQIGTYDITIIVSSSGMGRSINVMGSDGISQCQNVSFGGLYLFSGIVVNSVNPVFISTSGGTC